MIIEICCNSGKNGLFEGKATAIKFGDVCYEAVNNRSVTITDFCSRIRIHRKEFKYISMKEWVGNWCWNAYKFSEKDADRLHKAVLASGMWYASDI